MKKLFPLLAITFGLTVFSPAKADFGDADFPTGMFDDGPKSYHDAWCRKIGNKCRVRFQGPAMWVEGQGGIQRDQLIRYRYDLDGAEYYNYVTYRSKDDQQREALFLFANSGAQQNFLRALMRWKKQEARPIPNYRLPASQGPQETHGRDKSYGVPMNPYENPPITDWKKKTTR